MLTLNVSATCENPVVYLSTEGLLPSIKQSFILIRKFYLKGSIFNPVLLDAPNQI